MLKYAYPLLLVASVIFILWKGGFEERLALLTLLVGSVLTALIHINATDWLQLNVALVVNELCVTAVMLWIALRSKRFWPLPVAAFQTIALIVLLVSHFGEDIQAQAVGISQGMWAYLQLLILIGASFRTTKPQTLPRGRLQS